MEMDQANWWRSAVIYQVYPRSFADANGDGMGDLPGVISRLPYLVDLGVDALWLNPFYESPQNDAGYDVANYRQVDPLFGSLTDAELLITRAHECGLRVIFDIVPNHTSSDHLWFTQALTSAPGSGAWDRYHCVRGRGAKGELPPNDWMSVFGGDGWSQIMDPKSGAPSGWWYLHLFDSTQPDLNWSHPDVRAEHEAVLRFWFDRGVDGFRIDVAHGLVKADGYPMSGEGPNVLGVVGEVPVRPQWDQPGVHEIYRSWRAIADSYEPPRVFCGEVWVSTPEAHALYLRPDELHTAFNFHYLRTHWDSIQLREIIDHSIAVAASVGAPCTWVLSNHDVWRHTTRLAPTLPDGSHDLEEGLLRARAATLAMLALPGSAYIYQGEELGLPEVLDIPDAFREDPVFHRTQGEALGRDGCRVPIPWSGDKPSFGFGPEDASWLPQPSSWAELSAAAQKGVAGSTLEMYRTALHLRHNESALGDGHMEWHDSDPDVLAFTRPGDPAVTCVINLSSATTQWPAETLLVASDARVMHNGDQVTLPPSSAAWLR